jgi:hypothetical protein
MVANALFDINADGEDRGFEAAQSQVLTLRLRTPVDPSITTVLFQVWNPAGADPELGIAANPPRASSGAPTLTIVGATSGQAVSPTTVSGTVSITLPASSGHSYIVRCVVNGGWRALPGGGVALEPTFIHERGVFIPTGFGLRKVVSTEVNQFAVEGWADAVNDMIAIGGAPAESFLPSGLGAVARQIGEFLDQGIHVFNFMSDAVRADAIACTLGYDHQPMIQLAIDYTIYRNSNGLTAPGCRLQLGGAVYRADRPIHAGYGIGFRSMIIEGEGQRFGGNNHGQGSGTAIVAMHDDGPCIVVQGGRNVVLRQFSLIGPNFDHCVSKVVSPDMTGLDVATWSDPSFPAAASSRYAPNAGIAIDPYSGVQPATHYPAVEYPAYFGAVAQYGKEASSNTQIDAVAIWGFVVGLAQQPCDYDGNGDYTKLHRVSIQFCAYAYSWGNSQSRVVSIEHCSFVGCHTGLATGVHGKRQGKPSVTAIASDFSQLLYWYDLPTLGFAEGPSFTGCFGEACYALGRVSGAGQAGGITFSSCEVGFTFWELYGVPAVVHDHDAISLARFQNCQFYDPIGIGMWNFAGHGFGGNLEGARNYEFSGCGTIVFGSHLDERYAMCAFNGTLGITITDGSTCLDRYSCRSGSLHNLDTGDALAPALFNTWNRGDRSVCLNVYTRQAKSMPYANDPGVPVAWRSNGINASGGILSQVGRVVTFIFPGCDTNYLALVGGDVGDAFICHRTNALFYVKARTGDHITAVAQSGFDVDGNLLMPLLDTDEFYTVHCRRYMPSVPLYGDMTSGSPTITNIKEGGGGVPASLAAHFTVGDSIYCDNEVDRFIYPYSASILSMDNTAKSITFANNFEHTRTRVRLGPFVRLPMPNAA